MTETIRKSTLTPTDEIQANHPDSNNIGPITVEVNRDETHIYLELGEPVEWLRLTPDVARTIARKLVILADVIDVEQTCITPPDKD